MRNRLIIGALRYGVLHSPRAKYDHIGDCIRRLKLYQKDRNKEHLVDVANLCLCEFEAGDGHFTSVDDGVHVEALK